MGLTGNSICPWKYTTISRRNEWPSTFYNRRELFSVKRKVFEWESAYHLIWIWVLGPQVVNFIFLTIKNSSIYRILIQYISGDLLNYFWANRIIIDAFWTKVTVLKPFTWPWFQPHRHYTLDYQKPWIYTALEQPKNFFEKPFDIWISRPMFITLFYHLLSLQ